MYYAEFQYKGKWWRLYPGRPATDRDGAIARINQARSGLRYRIKEKAYPVLPSLGPV